MLHLRTTSKFQSHSTFYERLCNG